MPRGYVILLALMVLPGGIASAWRAGDRFFHPPVIPWASGQTWYENLLAALLYLVIFGACVSYEIRRSRATDQPVIPRGERPWDQKIELRLVLMAFAAAQFAAIPLELLEAWQRSHLLTPWGRSDSFWSALQLPDMILPPIVGTAIVLYDRHRLRRAKRADQNLCSRCGYDLRATPDRCPECGTVPSTSGFAGSASADARRSSNPQSEIRNPQ